MEREISFRTESGLYYSYYKQLVNTPSFVQGNTAMHTVNMRMWCLEIFELSMLKFIQTIYMP